MTRIAPRSWARKGHGGGFRRSLVECGVWVLRRWTAWWVVCGVAEGSSLWGHPGGWDPVDGAVADFGVPAAVVQQQVVAVAGQDQLVDVGLSALGGPKSDVVGRCPLRTPATSRPGAAFVPDGQCPPLFWGGGALGAAQIQHLALTIEDRGYTLVSHNNRRSWET